MQVRTFALRGRRLNDTVEHRRGVFYQPNMMLTFDVCGYMPLLEVRWRYFY